MHTRHDYFCLLSIVPYKSTFDVQVQSPHRVFIGRYLELTIRLVSHGSFQHGCGFSGIQHLVESYHSFSASQGAQGEVEDASMPGDEASRRKSVTAEQESICISSGQFSTVPVTTKSHIVGISGLNIYRAVIINRCACMRWISCFNKIGPLRLCPAMRKIVRSAHGASFPGIRALRSRLTVGRPSVWCAYAGSTRIVQGTSRVDAYPDALNTTLLLSALLLELRRGRLQNSPAHVPPAVRILPLVLYQWQRASVDSSGIPQVRSPFRLVVASGVEMLGSLLQGTLLMSQFPVKGGGALQNAVEWSSTQGVTAVLCCIPCSSPFVTPGVTVSFGRSPMRAGCETKRVPPSGEECYRDQSAAMAQYPQI
ncbi:hypothetical protein T09_5684 [Trichinella sp. T9]|nr:hypothetical protein T09_5684 [Trichinella sp. T9]